MSSEMQEYEVGDLYERKDHEYEVVAKVPHYNNDGTFEGNVYLVKSRMFGSIYNTFTIGTDGWFSMGYKKVKNFHPYHEMERYI